MGSDEMIDFEASNYDELIEKFIETHRSEWDAFVYAHYQEYYADTIDHAKDSKA